MIPALSYCLEAGVSQPSARSLLQDPVARYVLSGREQRGLQQVSSCLQTVSVLVVGQTSVETGQRKQVYFLGLYSQ